MNKFGLQNINCSTFTKAIYCFLSILILLTGIISCRDKNKVTQLSIVRNEEKRDYKIFSIKRGINISHWLSQNRELNPDVLSQLFNEQDIKFLFHAGYDHLRIPVDEMHLWDEQGKKRQPAFQLLHKAITECINCKMKIILDLHEIRSHSFNNEKNILWKDDKEKIYFVQLWLQLSEEFKKYPVDYMAYELLNEPVAENPDDWNELLKNVIQNLRIKEPNRKIIIGSNRWQTPNTFNELVVPADDKNIIVSFHFYTPFLLTHYKAPWTEIKDYDGAVRYPGQLIDNANLANYSNETATTIEKYNGFYTSDSLLNHIRKPLEYAKKYKLQLYCGEFGCLPTVHRVERLNWYRDVREIFESNDIAWANWDYKGAFSIFNEQNGNPDEKLISVLLNDSLN
jgi:endoglucanase